MLAGAIGCDETSTPLRQQDPPPVGTIRILAEPDSLGVEWTLSGPDGYLGTGTGSATIVDRVIGPYVLAWTGRSGWNRPDPAIVASSLAADDTLVFTGTFTGRDFTPGTILIPAGQARIGSPAAEIDRGTDELRHRITLTRSYLIRDTEVTQAEYAALSDTNPSYFADCPDCPVEHLSWLDAIGYCNARSLADGLDAAYSWDDEAGDWHWDQAADGWRLPTEAEWEFACRTGVLDQNPFQTGACLDAATTANYDGQNPYSSCDAGPDRTHTLEVARLAPSSRGLYDMHGNVWEWCWDYYAPNAYVDSQIDPTGALSSYARVARGGSWQSQGRHCRSAFRGNFYPYSPDGYFGLRLVRWAD